MKSCYEEGTDGETSRKAKCVNKVMSGDAQGARESILLPLAPERSSKCCKKSSREKSSMSEIMTEEEHSHQQADSSGHEKGTANTSAGRSEK